MSEPWYKRGRLWILAALALALLATHGAIIYYASRHLAMSAGLMAGMMILILIKHLGFL